MLNLIKYIFIVLLFFSCTKKKDNLFDSKMYKHSIEITKEFLKHGDIKHQLFSMRVKEIKNLRIKDVSKKLNEFDIETVGVISYIEEMKRTLIEMNSELKSNDFICPLLFILVPLINGFVNTCKNSCCFGSTRMILLISSVCISSRDFFVVSFDRYVLLLLNIVE